MNISHFFIENFSFVDVMITYSEECLKAFDQMRNYYLKYMRLRSAEAEYMVHNRIAKKLMKEERDNHYKAMMRRCTFTIRRCGS